MMSKLSSEIKQNQYFMLKITEKNLKDIAKLVEQDCDVIFSIATIEVHHDNSITG